MGKCLFCDNNFFSKDKIIAESQKWRAILDGFPISLGHTLIIPKRHMQSFFDLSFEEYEELYIFIREVKEKLHERYNSISFNIGINDGELSGQTIPHLHIHIIPRYENDGGLPCGVRNVFPQEIANYKKNK